MSDGKVDYGEDVTGKEEWLTAAGENPFSRRYAALRQVSDWPEAFDE